MFERLNEKNTFVESLEALIYLIKENPVRSVVYCGAIPLAIPWILHNSVTNGFALQAYLVTTFVFALEPFRNKKLEVKKWRFWKAMLIGGILIHPLFLYGMWYLDRTNTSFVNGAATLFLLVLVAGVLESIVLGNFVNRFLPARDATSGRP
jgi:EamA domain-containing membrane protein RarD